MKASMMIVRSLTLIFLAIIAVLGMLFLLRYDGPGTTDDNGTVNSSSATSKKASLRSVPVVLYYVALGDDGKAGERIGCGDSLVPIVADPTKDEDVVRVAMERLLAGRSHMVPGTALHDSLSESELSMVSLSTGNDTVKVYLSGSLNLGGVCDGPRVEAQLAQTAKTASAKERVEIYLNDRPLGEALSQR